MMNFQQIRSNQQDKYIGWYVVAFLDLLGQQENLRKLAALPSIENQEKLDSFKKKVRNFYEPLTALRKWFSDSISSFMKGGIDKSRLTNEEKEVLQEIQSTPIFYRHFLPSFPSCTWERHIV